MTNLSNIAIWEALSNNTDIKDLLINVPDEFYNKVKSYVKDLRYSFISIKEHAGKLYDNYMENLDYNTISKKHFAEFTKNQPKHLHDILYKMYDRKKYDSIIWKLLKPKYKKL
jgi:DNA replication initiation complex subunit (GINS family)